MHLTFGFLKLWKWNIYYSFIFLILFLVRICYHNTIVCNLKVKSLIKLKTNLKEKKYKNEDSKIFWICSITLTSSLEWEDNVIKGILPFFLVIVIENHNFNINNIFDIKTTALDLQAISDGKKYWKLKKKVNKTIYLWLKTFDIIES